MHKKKVLIIEDDTEICEMLGLILQKNGFEACLQYNGKHAVSQILKLHPYAVIMDLWMPGIDGSAVTQKIKKNPKTKNVPVILVSAKNRLEDIAKKSGADAFIAKPFSVSQLLGILNSLTESKQMQKKIR